MKSKTLRSLLLLSVTALFAFTIAADPLEIGAAMPKADLKMKDVSGKEVTLQGSMQENGLLVIFSCNTCPVVINNQERHTASCNFAKENKVGVIVLNSNEANRGSSESLEAMKAYANNQSYQWTYAEDKNNVLADAFGATRTPECFLFDKNGKLVYHGAIDDSPNSAESVKRKHLNEAITELAAGKEVSVKKSKSVGCSIKRI